MTSIFFHVTAPVGPMNPAVINFLENFDWILAILLIYLPIGWLFWRLFKRFFIKNKKA